MQNDDSRDEPMPVFSPLLEKMTTATLLQVYESTGRKLQPALDARGRLITLLATETLEDLAARIIRPGRYRVVHRDDDGQWVSWQEYIVRPASAADGPKEPKAPPPSPPEGVLVPHLMERVSDLRDQLERERRAHEDMKQLLEGRAQDAIERAHKAEVAMTEFRTRHEAVAQRLHETEQRYDELLDELRDAQEQASAIKDKASEESLNPLDMVMQMDGMLETLTKVADRFTSK